MQSLLNCIIESELFPSRGSLPKPVSGQGRGWCAVNGVSGLQQARCRQSWH